jgi:AcrR family transcriptional regulator
MSKTTRATTAAGLTWARLEATPAPDRVPLSRAEIVATAIRLIDEGGIDACSMRRLGTELGAGATSLYWHVRNKDELIDLIVDEIIGEVVADYEATARPDASWRDQLAEIARSLRRVLLVHRHIAPLLGERPTLGPNALDAAERVMGILLEAGFDHRRTSMGSGAVINYASGFAIFESRMPEAAAQEPAAEELAAAVMAYLESLPEERYPNMRAVAQVTITETEQFEFGLQRLLDGLEANLANLADEDLTGEDLDPASTKPGGNVMLRR